MEDKFWEDILPKKKSCNALHPACCHIPIGLSKYNRAYNNGRSDCLTALKEAELKGLICKVPSNPAALAGREGGK